MAYNGEKQSVDDLIAEKIFQSLGAASTCWDNLSGAGVFESTRAKEIGEQLVKDLDKLYGQKFGSMFEYALVHPSTETIEAVRTAMQV